MFCEYECVKYFHITKLIYWERRSTRAEKQKDIFYGKHQQKSGAGRLCQQQTLFGK